MRIKFVVSLAGPNFSYSPNTEVDWKDEAEAQRLIKAGIAIRVGPAPTRERATGRGQARETAAAGPSAEQAPEGKPPAKPARTITMAPPRPSKNKAPAPQGAAT